MSFGPPPVIEEQELSPAELRAFIGVRAREGYEKAWNEQRWGHALSAVVAGLYFRCLHLFSFVASEDELPPRSQRITFDAAARLRTQIGDAARRKSDPAGLQLLVLCLDDLCNLLALAEGLEHSPDEETHLVRAVLAGERVGAWGPVLQRIESGELERLAKLEAIMDRLKSQVGRKPEWEDGFAPAAAAFCMGRSAVSLGALVREAKRWGEKELAEGRNPGLPGTEEGIKRGLKRMEKQGVLAIPGRSRSVTSPATSA